MPLLVKICGLSTGESVECAVQAGADMIGFVFHPKSPRYVTPRHARDIAKAARGRAEIVALNVDAEDAFLADIHAALKPDMWQMHGSEPMTRLVQVRERFNLPVMKAIGVAVPADLAAVSAYARVLERILLDAKPPGGAAYPGGHGQPFDWQILSALPPALPFVLSGGLTPENVGDAIRTLRDMRAGLMGVDVSSGVETAPGVKDLGKIRAFIAAVREA